MISTLIVEIVIVEWHCSLRSTCHWSKIEIEGTAVLQCYNLAETELVYSNVYPAITDGDQDNLLALYLEGYCCIMSLQVRFTF